MGQELWEAISSLSVFQVISSKFENRLCTKDNQRENWAPGKAEGRLDESTVKATSPDSKLQMPLAQPSHKSLPASYLFGPMWKRAIDEKEPNSYIKKKKNEKQHRIKKRI